MADLAESIFRDYVGSPQRLNRPVDNGDLIGGIYRDYLFPPKRTVARTNQFGEIEIGGEIGASDVLNEFDASMQPAAEIIADVVPGSAQERSVGRLSDLVDERAGLEDRPIRGVLNSAEIGLEGLGLAADLAPGLKALGLGGAALASIMARRTSPLSGLATAPQARLQQGVIGSPMAERVDKRVLAERRVNKLFDGAIEFERRKAPRRKDMAVRNEDLPMDVYVYHGTGEGAFRSIRNNGLEPKNGKTYFSNKDEYAKTYASMIIARSIFIRRGTAN